MLDDSPALAPLPASVPATSRAPGAWVTAPGTFSVTALPARVAPLPSARLPAGPASVMLSGAPLVSAAAAVRGAVARPDRTVPLTNSCVGVKVTPSELIWTAGVSASVRPVRAWRPPSIRMSLPSVGRLIPPLSALASRLIAVNAAPGASVMDPTACSTTRSAATVPSAMLSESAMNVAGRTPPGWCMTGTLAPGRAPSQAGQPSVMAEGSTLIMAAPVRRTGARVRALNGSLITICVPANVPANADTFVLVLVPAPVICRELPARMAPPAA